jgi:hypothetical protein
MPVDIESVCSKTPAEWLASVSSKTTSITPQIAAAQRRLHAYDRAIELSV